MKNGEGKGKKQDNHFKPAIKTHEYESALAEMNGTSPNVARSLKLLEKARDLGDARASYAIATWYLHGNPPFVLKDIGRAFDLLKEAAAAHVPDALYDLAVGYEKGDFGSADTRLAFDSYLKAALRGEVQSVYEVGRCYFYGIGVEMDPRIADIWLERAAELGIE